MARARFFAQPLLNRIASGHRAASIFARCRAPAAMSVDEEREPMQDDSASDQSHFSQDHTADLAADAPQDRGEAMGTVVATT